MQISAEAVARIAFELEELARDEEPGLEVWLTPQPGGRVIAAVSDRNGSNVATLEVSADGELEGDADALETAAARKVR